MLNEVIDTDRVQRRLNELAEIGKTDAEGVTRLAYTNEENAAFEYMRGELPDDYVVREDAIGNLFATREPDADQSIYLGSHLDSVHNGGRLDGALGVLVALEAIESAYQVEEPPVAPTLIILRGEESARFGQHTIGSRGALGMLTVEALSSTDEDGVPIWLAMQQAGFGPENLADPTIDLDKVAGFLELHIEQGRVLDQSEDEKVGIVTSIRAPVRYEVTVEGDNDHSGATPMGLRRDALAGASEMITAIEKVGTEASAEDDIVVTVGNITAHEGAINKVCGKVTFPIDLRSNDATSRSEIESQLVDELEAIADHRSVELEMELIDRSDPVELDEEAVDFLRAGAEESEVSYRRMPSGGGHDAMNFQLAGVTTGMLFVPSTDGVSHNPDEATNPKAIQDAIKIMARALLTWK